MKTRNIKNNTDNNFLELLKELNKMNDSEILEYVINDIMDFKITYAQHVV